MTCLAAVFHGVDSADLIALGHLKSYSKSGTAPRNPNPGRKCSVIKGPNSPCFPPSLIDASGISLILRTPPNPTLRQHRKSAALKLVPILSLIYSHPSVTPHPFPTLTLSFYKNVETQVLARPVLYVGGASAKCCSLCQGVNSGEVDWDTNALWCRIVKAEHLHVIQGECDRRYGPNLERWFSNNGVKCLRH